jgi:LAO/AO transport system kinase
MEKLALHPNAFIRPSPSGGTLGGVAQRTREASLLCEAAGFDIIIIETVGVGQSEAAVRSMVDCFLLLTVTGTGDELQAIKRGVMELADVLIVNKADGDNRLRAERLASDLRRALHYLPQATPGWNTSVHPVSSLSGDGMNELWATITRFRDTMTASGQFESRRKSQIKDWFYSLLRERALESVLTHSAVSSELPSIEKDVSQGTLDVGAAVDEVMNHFLKAMRQHPS